MASKIPETTGTLSEYILYGSSSDQMTYHKFNLLEKAGEIQYPVKNVLLDYLNEINQIKVRVKLTDNEFNHYCYRPRLLAYDLYGSTDLYFLIMLVNNICDEKDFCSKSFYIINPQNLAVINDILIAEKDYIDANHYEVDNQV